MKKLITMIVLALGITFSAQAQKTHDETPLTTDQKTVLKVKKMILKLDLTEKQAKQVTPLVKKQIEERAKMHEKRKAFKESGKKLTADERFAFAEKNLDKKIALKNSMKQILNEEQFKKYEKMMDRKKGKRKGKKEGKGKKEQACKKTSCAHKE